MMTSSRRGDSPRGAGVRQTKGVDLIPAARCEPSAQIELDGGPHHQTCGLCQPEGHSDEDLQRAVREVVHTGEVDRDLVPLAALACDGEGERTPVCADDLAEQAHARGGVRRQNEEEIVCEVAAHGQPRGMAPRGSVTAGACRSSASRGALKRDQGPAWISRWRRGLTPDPRGRLETVAALTATACPRSRGNATRLQPTARGKLWPWADTSDRLAYADVYPGRNVEVSCRMRSARSCGPGVDPGAVLRQGRSPAATGSRRAAPRPLRRLHPRRIPARQHAVPVRLLVSELRRKHLDARHRDLLRPSVQGLDLGRQTPGKRQRQEVLATEVGPRVTPSLVPREPTRPTRARIDKPPARTDNDSSRLRTTS